MPEINKINVGGVDFDIGGSGVPSMTKAEFRTRYNNGEFENGQLVNIKDANTLDLTADMISYETGVSVGDELDEIKSALTKEKVTYHAAQGETVGHALEGLTALVDFTKITGNSFIEVDGSYYRLRGLSTGVANYVVSFPNASLKAVIDMYTLYASGCKYERATSTDYTNKTNDTLGSARDFNLYY